MCAAHRRRLAGHRRSGRTREQMMHPRPLSWPRRRGTPRRPLPPPRRLPPRWRRPQWVSEWVLALACTLTGPRPSAVQRRFRRGRGMRSCAMSPRNGNPDRGDSGKVIHRSSQNGARTRSTKISTESHGSDVSVVNTTVFGGGGVSRYVRPVGLVHSSSPRAWCFTCQGEACFKV